MAWLTARYLIESEPELIEKRANALALEQSVECPLEAIGSQFVLDEIVARVDGIKELGERRYLVDVISYNRVRGLPFRAAELAGVIQEVIAHV